MECPCGKKQKLRVRLAQASGNLFVACTGFPSCKYTMKMPKGITACEMLDKDCPVSMEQDQK